MAYAATVTTQALSSRAPNRAWEVTISATEVAATSEESFTLPIPRCYLTSIKARKASGTATTLAPIAGRVTDPGSAAIENQIFDFDAAASVDYSIHATGMPILIVSPERKCFFRYVPDAGADNTVTIVLVLEETWGGA